MPRDLGESRWRLNIKGCRWQVKFFKMAEVQVKIRVCLPYVAGKISSCNFRDTITQRKSNIFSTVQIFCYCREPSNWYKYSTYRKVTFMFILSHLLQGRSKLCRAGRNKCLPAILGKCLQKLMLNPASAHTVLTFTSCTKGLGSMLIIHVCRLKCHPVS